jgi:hypothetical protein
MNLTLTDEETILLSQILKNHLADFREEIGKTENRTWRAEMKHDEVVLNGVIARLQAKVA